MQSSAYTRGVTSGAFRAVAWVTAAAVLAAGLRRVGRTGPSYSRP